MPVNDTAAPAAGGQSQKETGQRVMFSLTKYVQIQLLPTCLASDIICPGLGSEVPRRRQLVSKPQYCNLHLFYNGCGNCPYLFYPRQLCMYIMFSRSAQIPLRHPLSHFIFLSKTFFLPFTSVHFSIKITNWSNFCPLHPFLSYCLKCQYYSQGRGRNGHHHRHQPQHDDCFGDTCYDIFLPSITFETQ